MFETSSANPGTGSLIARFLDDRAETALLAADASGRVREWSAGAAALFGCEAPEAVGSHLSRVYGAEAELDLIVAAAGGPARRDASVVLRSGKTLRLALEVRALRDADGALLGFGLLAQPSEPAAGRDPAARLLELLELASDALLIFNREGRAAMVSDGAERLFGAGRAALLGCGWDDPVWGLTGASGEPAPLPFLRVQRTAELLTIPSLCRHGRELSLRSAQLRESGQVVFIFRDDRGTRRAAALEAAAAYRSLLELRLMEAEENERRRLARELHDEAGQAFALLSAHLSDQAPESRIRAAESAAALGRELSRITHELRPAPLDNLGLGPALAMLAERFSARSEIAVDYLGIELDGRFPPQLEAALYRIVQEALTNVARHSGATEVRVRAWRDAEGLGARIEDNGCGIDAADAPKLEGGKGLAGMRSRAELLGGQFRAASHAGSGTRIEAMLPLFEAMGEGPCRTR